MKYVNTLAIVLIFGVIIFAGIHRSTGITGRTNKTNQGGCTCHSPEPDNSVNVQVSGPDTLVKGQTAEYQITLSGGPAVFGGFNVASAIGVLSPVDNSAQLLSSELTHTSPKSFSGGSVTWNFTLTAADQVYTDTLFSASNSVNGDGFNSSLDRWNFGQKFVVYVVDQTTSIENEELIPNSFMLKQNYPNPFNPSTKISWSSATSGHHTLKIYDITGNEVATLVDEFMPAGNNEVEFNANNFSSGVYFYKLVAGNQTETKKMILMK
jgi:hypothetical protein